MYKKSLFRLTLAGLLTVTILGCSAKPASSDKTDETETVAETTETVEEETSEVTSQEQTKSKKELKKEFEETAANGSLIFDKKVRNDVTGNWRLARYASPENFLDHAVDYYNAYFESDDEIHYVINFTLNTTSVIHKMPGMDILDVTVKEYVSKEEHDADLLGSGTVLGQYWVHLDTGEVEKIED